MPWREVSLMDQRKEFVRLLQQPDVNRRELCRRFGVSPKVGYKWLTRATAAMTIHSAAASAKVTLKKATPDMVRGARINVKAV